MTFRNTTTATQHKLGLIAAQQHAYERKHGGIPQRNLLEFNDWLEVGFDHYKTIGWKIEKLPLSVDVMYFMTNPEGVVVPKLESEFQRTYEISYLRRESPSFCEVV